MHIHASMIGAAEAVVGETCLAPVQCMNLLTIFRKAGVEFGPDHTPRFCERKGLSASLIVQARDALGWDQRTLSRKAGVGVPAVQSAEGSGGRRPISD